MSAPTPTMASRKVLIDFAAGTACRHRVPGTVIRRLMRLVERWRKGKDSGPDLTQLEDDIVATIPHALFSFHDNEVYVDGFKVP
mgnify:FL=1